MHAAPIKLPPRPHGRRANESFGVEGS
jgi:hypothetical protein